jgi:uncharacterized protein YciW
MIRVPRSQGDTIRASLALMTSLDHRRVVLSVRAVSGSSRTARLAAVKELKKHYREKLARLTSKSEHAEICKKLEESIENVMAIS